MISKQEVIYKGIKEIPSGTFTNEKGETINYKESYKFRFELIYNGLPQIFEIKCTKEFALNCAKNTKINEKLMVTFVFNIYPNGRITCNIQSIEKI